MTDTNFERALRSAARRGRTAGVCPDAAILAAYVDRSVSDDERSSIEAHVANCMACTEQLALLAALDVPSDQTAPTPSFDVGALIRKWGWLVPAMTAVVVIAVWLRSSDDGSAVRPTTMAQRTVPSAPAEQRAEPAPSGREAAPQNATELQTKRDAADRDSRLKAAARLGVAAPVSTVTDAAKPASPPPPVEAEEKSEDTFAERNLADEKDKEAAQRQDYAAAAPQPPPSAAASPATGADAREGTLAKAAPAPLAGNAAVGGRMRKVTRQESAAVAPVLVRTTGGRIERSTDSGLSWTTEHTGLSDQIQVALCPTTTACWLGADNGAVYVRNGEGQWVRRAVPPPAAPVQTIAAVDNQHATVALSDGRRYSTADGGVTWTVAPAPR